MNEWMGMHALRYYDCDPGGGNASILNLRVFIWGLVGLVDWYIRLVFSV